MSVQDVVDELEARAAKAAAELVAVYAVTGRIDEDRLIMMAERARPDAGWPTGVTEDAWVDDVRRRAKMAGELCRPGGVENVIGCILGLWACRMKEHPGQIAREGRASGAADVHAKLMASFRIIGGENGKMDWARVARDLVRWSRAVNARGVGAWP